MSEVIVQMELPKDCLWVEDGEIHKCPLLEYNYCCMGQSDEANEAAESWSDLRKGCPIVGVLPEQHGRLIDASTVLFEAEESDDVVPPIPVTVDDYLLLFDLPTIVPAAGKAKYDN